ncbi:DUF2306 domain-containing protein [Salinibacterium sp. SYSU T00001]|uniref:DUF2306 domain-containing protein n=1 Tax=Homoserinimonas sedimenticola TaxID=2986805 RepID=UPI002236539F|nr:DUF2306 domain-containing protein [Salinibacterium sedimenticola]MCW4386090.1 DUF2306 domain-containing protein [Salinibacterium sedimenticola]
MNTQIAQKKEPMRQAGRRAWVLPTALILLSLIPVLAGSVRVGELAGSAEVTAANARFFDSPVPVVSHIIGATLYSLLGAFQFSASLRRGRWHRVAGLVLIPAGLITAVSGLWMTVAYDLPASDGDALLVVRLIFGLGMLLALLRGVRSLARRNFSSHGAWMTRAYAIGVAAGTQAVIMIVPSLVLGELDATTKAVLMTTAWVLNLAVAEHAIRRRAGRR